jgi:membrane protein implicated in regulation of membrane protease activity
MNRETFYLICFLIGLAFSILSLFAGRIHLRLPHIHVHLGSHAPVHGSAAGSGLGFLNFGTIAAFLAWFGGAGYLLAHYSVWFAIALGVAIASGIGGAAIVFLFLTKVLIRTGEELDPADYDMVGVLGTVSSNIRPSGTGEMIFLQKGVRRAAPARGEDSIIIQSGTEVVVTRYEHGIAYVRPWEELTNSSTASQEGV